MLLASCASDDPNSGGFFGGLIGLGSGAYQERLAAERATLEAEKSRYHEQLNHQDHLDESATERRAEAAELGDRLASLRADVDGLDAEIAALQSEEGVTVEQVQRAEADVAALVGDIDRIEAEQEAHTQAKALGADADVDTDPAEFGEPPREQVSELRAYINKLQAAVDALKLTREKRAREAGAKPDDATD